MRDFKNSGRNNFRNKFSDRGGDRPMMHEAVCDDCGRDCEVPFKPSGNKEIFCSNCFDKRGGREGRDDRNNRNDRYDRDDRGGRNNRYDESFGNRPGRGSSNFERRDGEREMFNAICDECGKNCKLPFKPTSNKPVYCSDCFDMRGERSGLVKNTSSRSTEKGSDTGKEVRELKDQMISLNVKLDKIISALNIKEVPAKSIKVSKEAYKEATTEEPAEVVTEEAKKTVKKAKKTEDKDAEKAVEKKSATKKTAAKKTVKKAKKAE